MQNGRKYLSWDIGIKNLAYCLLQVNTDKIYNFEILFISSKIAYKNIKIIIFFHFCFIFSFIKDCIFV